MHLTDTRLDNAIHVPLGMTVRLTHYVRGGLSDRLSLRLILGAKGTAQDSVLTFHGWGHQHALGHLFGDWLTSEGELLWLSNE